MNKYQEFAVKQIKIIGDNSLKSFKWDFNKVVLEQNENYNLTKYTIAIHQASITKIEVITKDSSYEVARVDEYQHTLELDFENKISAIKLHFTEDIVDPVEIPIEYIDANKEIYDEKIRIENKKALDEKAKVKVNTGDSIINVTFQPINSSYSYSKVELYAVNGTDDYQLMAKYKTTEDVYFHSITGLAYGTYAIILVQYESNDKEIYKSDFIQVILKKPNYSGKPTVTARWL